MKITYLVLFGVCLGGMIGCQNQNQNQNRSSQTQRVVDRAIIDTLYKIQVENAIIAQHSLFPYHFIPDGNSLNELGQRELAVLTRHLAGRGGTLVVRQGEAPVELYKMRLSHVDDCLKRAGVEMSRVKIMDGKVGGDGMASDRLNDVLTASREASPTTTSPTSVTTE